MDGTVEHGYAEVTRSRHWRSVDVAGDDQVGRGATDPSVVACRYGRCSARYMYELTKFRRSVEAGSRAVISRGRSRPSASLFRPAGERDSSRRSSIWFWR